MVIVPWQVNTQCVEHALNVHLVRLHSCWVDVLQCTATDSKIVKS